MGLFIDTRLRLDVVPTPESQTVVDEDPQAGTLEVTFGGKPLQPGAGFEAAAGYAHRLGDYRPILWNTSFNGGISTGPNHILASLYLGTGLEFPLGNALSESLGANIGPSFDETFVPNEDEKEQSFFEYVGLRAELFYSSYPIDGEGPTFLGGLSASQPGFFKNGFDFGATIFAVIVGARFGGGDQITRNPIVRTKAKGEVEAGLEKLRADISQAWLDKHYNATAQDYVISDVEIDIASRVLRWMEGNELPGLDLSVPYSQRVEALLKPIQAVQQREGDQTPSEIDELERSVREHHAVADFLRQRVFNEDSPANVNLLKDGQSFLKEIGTLETQKEPISQEAVDTLKEKLTAYEEGIKKMLEATEKLLNLSNTFPHRGEVDHFRNTTACMLGKAGLCDTTAPDYSVEKLRPRLDAIEKKVAKVSGGGK